MPKFLGMEPRVALLVGGAVAVVAFLAWRARQAAGAASAQADTGAQLPDALPGSGAAAGAAGQVAQDQFAQQMQGLELASAQQEQQFRTGQLQRQAASETAQGALETAQAQGQADMLSQMYAWAQGKGKKPAGVQCPKGNMRFDPSTGSFYCRTKQHQSLGQAIGGWATGASHFLQQHPEAVAAVASEPSRPAPPAKRGFGVKKKVTR